VCVEEAPRGTPRSSRAPLEAAGDRDRDRDRDRENVFHLVRHKKVPELHHAMSSGGFNIECCDANGNTPLIVAAQNGMYCLK
jgi:ankyrin repeat protein